MLEPLRDQRAIEMPVFDSLLGTMRGVRGFWLLIPLATPGAATVSLRGEFTALTMAAVSAVAVLVLGILAVAWLRRRAIPWKALSELAGKSAFSEVSLPPEGLFSVGSKVYFKLPDADDVWAEVRLPKAARLQLAAQRRIWLLGPDEEGRRFLQLPGVLWPHQVTAVPSLPGDAVPLDEIDQRIVPPEEDVVLIAHRQRIAWGLRALFGAGAAALGLLVAIQVVMLVEDGPRPEPGLVIMTIYWLVLLVIGVDAAMGMLKPLPRGKWSELVAIPHAPPRIGASGLAALGCRIQWPDGRWSDAFMSKVDPALAANIWATQRLWIVGAPLRGTTTFAGVPGHAVLGRVRFN
ncbi:hypothetical protein AVL48_06305 [Amycolatopsis regifaucium]|uniref:Uncharacterized protein n=1 Tax=Amycolatopsis regifaucium TaxID=546365 RepID=A0A154MBF5_9PSEU|nr:hypothetical protein AVL48_06305 [Amycolatopsis regifaucium]